jgi:hypothetical protein
MTDPRPWTYAALFGALWGALELSLGTILHFAKIPLYGILMSLLGLLCLVTLRRLQPSIGVCLMAGLVAIFLKVFTMGGLRPGPLLGIGLQTLVVELAFTTCGSRRIAAAVAGAAAVASAPAQLVVGLWLFAGKEAVDAYVYSIESWLEMSGLAMLSVELLVGLVLAVTGVVGAAGGLWSWSIAGRVGRRLGGRIRRR